MKRILIIMVIACMFLTFGAGIAEEEIAWEQYAFLNGCVPHTEDYDSTRGDMAYYDTLHTGTIPSELKDGWEVRDGVLYDMKTKTLLAISNDADPGETLIVEPGTRYIGPDVLGLNENIKSIILPDTVEVIGQRALTGAMSMSEEAAIRTIYVPASVRAIHEPVGSCFYSSGVCKPTFVVDENNPRYASTPDGLLIDKLDGTVLWCDSRDEPRTVTVPEGIRRIAPYAFALCTEIISIELPDSLREIGKGAFCMMYGLTEITIPEKVLKVGTYCFSWSGCGSEWGLDQEGHIVRQYADGDPQPLTNEEVLLHMGIDRRPGIKFSGTAFLLLADDSQIDEYKYYDGFEECRLPVECPAGALCLEYMESYFKYFDKQLTIIEADGTGRVVSTE